MRFHFSLEATLSPKSQAIAVPDNFSIPTEEDSITVISVPSEFWIKGGPGSGNFDHAGRSGEVGGSGPGSGDSGTAAIPSFSELKVPDKGTKVDSRFAPVVQENWNDDRQTLVEWTSGKQYALADMTIGENRCVITDASRTLYFNSAYPNVPIPAGNWMGWWEEDLGVSEKAWGKLNNSEKAGLEAKLQLK